jgi:hypothetical protein
VALFGLFDLAIVLVLLVFLVSSVVLLLRPARGARAGRAGRAWPLAASLAGTGLFVVFNVAYFNGFGTDPVIGSPTDAQVTGTWVGSGGATLVLKPDGSFTASRLPPYVGQPKDFSDMLLGRNPPSGHGTLVIGPADFGGSPESVIFTLACSLPRDECANWNLTFDLQAENSGPPGSPALFYYQGDPDDWSDQYAFTRQ